MKHSTPTQFLQLSITLSPNIWPYYTTPTIWELALATDLESTESAFHPRDKPVRLRDDLWTLCSGMSSTTLWNDPIVRHRWLHCSSYSPGLIIRPTPQRAFGVEEL
jgi:hypothetical protein